MTGPSAPLEGAREALAAAIPTDIDGLAIVEYGCDTRWVEPETLADQLLAALSSAGYTVVKVEEQRTEYAVHGCSPKLVEITNPHDALGFAEKFNGTAMQRQVGPWVPVSGEGNDG